MDLLILLLSKLSQCEDMMGNCKVSKLGIDKYLHEAKKQHNRTFQAFLVFHLIILDCFLSMPLHLLGFCVALYLLQEVDNNRSRTFRVAIAI